MNTRAYINNPPSGIKRIWRKIMLSLSQLALLPPGLRLKCVKMGGVRIDGACYIGSNVTFDGLCPHLISVGNGTTITSGTVILSHFFIPEGRRYYAGEVNIGKKVFIGVNTLIVNAVNIGDYAVIGAGSVVNRDIPAGEIWAGNPARFIKKAPLVEK